MLVKWNEVLLNVALPELWIDALTDLTTEMEAHPSAKLIQWLPSMDAVANTDPAWEPCVRALYMRAASATIMPHVHGDTIEWIRPQSANLLEVSPTNKFAMLRDYMMTLYAECAPVFDAPILHVASHIEAAFREYCEVPDIATADYIEALLCCVEPVHRMTSLLLALAEWADREPRSVSLDTKWKRILADHAWVPLRCPQQSFVRCCDAFAPNVGELSSACLSVVETRSAAIDNEAALRSLIRWGLKQQLSWDDVLREAHLVVAVDHADRLLRYVNDNIDKITIGATGLSREDALKKLGEHYIVPGKDPAQWPGQDVAVRLLPASEVCHISDHAVVWATHASATQSHDKLYHGGMQRRLVTATDLAQQIRRLAEWGHDDGADAIECHLKTATARLLQTNECCAVLKTLRGTAWLPSLRDDGTRRLLKPEHVTLSWTCNLQPLFGLLDPAWQVLWNPELLTAAGVSQKLSVSTVSGALSNMAHKHDVLDDSGIQLAVNLVQELGKRFRSTSIVEKHRICVPTSCRRLQDSCSVFIDDAEWTSAAADVKYLLHDDVPTSVGRALGCTSLRAELARSCEMSNDNTIGEDFSQFERLDVRIRNLLREYDGELDVFTEHWQNSDDAGAAQLSFVLDEGNYGTDSLVTDKCSVLQGPALLLASSQPLTSQDIARIQSLGDSHKKAKFAQAGHFGVGLTCIYRITDCPTLLAAGALLVMDPLEKCVTGGGKKYSVKKLKDSAFLDTMAPFKHMDLQQYPTVFRLPIRQTSAVRGDGFGECLSTATVEKMLHAFAQTAPELMLFSKNIAKVEFSIRRTSGLMDSLAVLTATRSGEGARTVMQHLPQTIEEVRELVKQPIRQIDYVDITVESIHKEPMQKDRWLVSHVIDLNDDLLSLIEKQLQGGIAMLPHGAAAVRIDASPSYDGCVCCYLPLAAMRVGTPLVLHGCFGLKPDRKSVPCSGEDLKHRWNRALLTGPVSLSLALLVRHCCDRVKDGSMSFETWQSLTQIVTDSKRNRSTSELRKYLCEAVPALLFALPVFPKVVLGASTVLHWESGPSAVLRVPSAQLSNEIQDALVMEGLPLILLKPDTCFPKVETLSPGRLCEFLRPLDIHKNAVLSDREAVLAMVRFIVSKQGSVRLLMNLPLLLRGDDTLSCFGAALCYRDHSSLLPHMPELFIHKDLRSAIQKGANSPEVRRALAEVGIVPFTPAEFAKYKVTVHENQLMNKEEWRSRALQMIRKCDRPGSRLTFQVPVDFADWKLILVKSPEGETCVALRDVGKVFSLAGIDEDFHKELRAALFKCGINLLPHVDYFSLGELATGVASGNKGLLDILSCAENSKHLGATQIEGLLRYFSSQEFKGKLSSQERTKICKLPLFLRADSSSGYGNVSDSSTKYVCVQDHERLPKLMSLDVMQSVCFLALPQQNIDILYKALELNVFTADEYVAKFVCGALRTAATNGSVENNQRLDALVCELMEWLNVSRVVEAAKTEHFVHSKASTLCRAADLINRAHPLMDAFATELSELVPSKSWSRRSELLEKLGMQPYPPSEVLIKVSRIIHERSQKKTPPAVETQHLALQIVDEMCRRIAAGTSSELVELLQATSSLCIAPVYCGGRKSVESLIYGKLPEAALQLVPLRNLILASECDLLACFSFHRLAVDNVPKEGHVNQAIAKYPDRMNRLLGCYCESRFVPIPAVVNQLRTVGQIVALDEHMLHVTSGHHVHRLLESILKYLDGRATEGNKLECAREAFEEIHALPCLPAEMTVDAAGKLEKGNVSIVEPQRCFVRLPDDAKSLSELPIFEYRPFPSLHAALGISEKPSRASWAWCTQFIGKRAQGEPLLPNEMDVIKVAVREMLKSDSTANGTDEVWLPDTTQHMHSAHELVWPDCCELQGLCKHMHFVDIGILPATADWTQVCAITGMQKLSDLVTETLEICTPTEPTEGEVRFEMLMHSAEFADGVAELVDRVDSIPKCKGDVIRCKLATLQLKWAKTIHSRVRGKWIPDGDVDECSRRSAFVDDNGLLWLQSGVLGTGEEQELMDAVLHRLRLDILKVRSIHKSNLVVSMLKCWDQGGPARIYEVLMKNGVTVRRTSEQRRPGYPIPRELHLHIKRSIPTPFYKNEIVAVAFDQSDDAFKFAQVVSDQDGARLKAGIGAPHGDLIRRYMLNEGEEQPVERKYFEIFKITRAASPSGGMVPANGDTEASDDDDREEIDPVKWASLKRLLREMVPLPEHEYCRVLRRLYLDWHPDTNGNPHACSVFQLIRAHSECFRTQGDFSWLSAINDMPAPEFVRNWSAVLLDPAKESNDALGDETTTPSLQENSYFSEFAREQRLKESRQRREDGAKVTWNLTTKESFKWASNLMEHRMQDEKQADLYWELADRQLVAVAVLLKEKLWAFATWHAHQAVELSIKSQMFRSCGITESELKGKGAHDLRLLLGRLIPVTSEWPASAADVGALSQAYLKSRYGQEALSEYTEASATQAHVTARKVIAWVRQQDDLCVFDGR